MDERAPRTPRDLRAGTKKLLFSVPRARMRAIQETFPARSAAKNRGTNQLMDVYEINDWPTRANRRVLRIETLPGLPWEIVDKYRSIV